MTRKVKMQHAKSGQIKKMEDFDIEIEGDSEDHQYALDLIKNLVEVAVNDGLPARILMEVAMVYSIQYNLEKGDVELMRVLFTEVLEQMGGSEGISSSTTTMH